MVRDSDPMRISGEVMQDMLWPAERPLCIHDPLLAEKLPEETLKQLRLNQIAKRSVEAELTATEQPLEAVDKLAAKYGTESSNREKEFIRRPAAPGMRC